MKSDDNAYAHEASFVVALPYIDDVMAPGKPGVVKKLFQVLPTWLLLKETRTLNDDGHKVRFVGRNLGRAETR